MILVGSNDSWHLAGFLVIVVFGALLLWGATCGSAGQENVYDPQCTYRWVNTATGAVLVCD